MKSNLTHRKKKSTTILSAFRLPIELKEEAQIFAIKNKTNLTDLVLRGLEQVIREK